MFIRFMALSTALIMLILSTGCDFTADSISINDTFKKIAGKTGAYAEQYIPEDMVFVASFDFSNESQHKSFDKLRANFATDEEWDELWQMAYDSMQDEELSLEKDIMPIWGDDPRVVFAADQKALEYAFGPKYTYEYEDEEVVEDVPTETLSVDGSVSGLTPLEESFIYSTNPNSEEVLEEDAGPVFKDVEFAGSYYAIIKIGDVKKYNELLELWEDKLAEKDPDEAKARAKAQKKAKKGDLVIWGEDDVHITRHQDMMILSNSEANLKAAVKRARKAEDSIKNNEQFEKVFDNLEYPHIGYMYVDMKAYLDSVISAAKVEDPELAGLLDGFYNTVMDFGDATGTAVVLEDGAIRMQSYSYIDESNLEKDDKGFEELAAELSLVDKVPGENMLLYEEISTIILKSLFSEVLKMAENSGLAAEGEIEKQFRAVTGLDLQKDILSWMDRSMALYMGDSGGLVPNFGLWIDASSNTGAAKTTMEVIDSTFTVGLMGLKANIDPDKADLIRKGDVNIRGENVNRIAIDFSEMSEADRALLGVDDLFAEEKFEFYYGVTGDNVALFALHNDLDKLYGGARVLAKSAEYKDGMKLLGGAYDEGAVIYFAPNVIFDYVDRLAEVVEKVEDYPLMDEDEMEIYEMIKKYVNPIKVVVAGSKISRTESESMAVIQIGE